MSAIFDKAPPAAASLKREVTAAKPMPNAAPLNPCGGWRLGGLHLLSYGEGLEVVFTKTTRESTVLEPPSIVRPADREFWEAWS